MIEGHLQSTLPVIGCEHGVAVVGQCSLEHIEHFTPVLDDKYGRGGTLGRSHGKNITVRWRVSKALAP
jgi:hypothetical protein